MGGIKKINQFNEAVDKLNNQEEEELNRSKHVIKAIAGSSRKNKLR